MAVEPKRGTLFWHKYFIVSGGQSGKTLCRVTTVRQGTVYYTYATDPSNKAAFKVPLNTWIERYGNDEA